MAELTEENYLEDEPQPCPMGCGRTTEDPYGGPCEKCWENAPPRNNNKGPFAPF